MEYKVYSPDNKISEQKKSELVDFLFTHLDEFGDEKEHIKKAVDYAMKDIPSLGGNLVLGFEDDQLIGAVVLNETGMGGYIPENILVYIAVHQDFRGKGLGRKLMSKAHEVITGDVALHVEPENPARYLYNNMGYTNKYLEMRLAQ